MRRIIILALLVLALVAPAAAWQEDFQTGSAYGWTTSRSSYTGGGVAVVQTPFSDTYALKISSSGDGVHNGHFRTAYPNPEQSFNYIAFTLLDGAVYRDDDQWNLYLYSESGSTICTLTFDPYCYRHTPCRVEVIRDGSTATLYVDGVSKTSATCSGQPYNAGFRSYTVSMSGYDQITIDDVVIGASEPDIIGIIPDTWYVLEHPTDPTMNGLYNAAGDSVYTHEMHITYGLDNAADADTKIVLRRVGEGYYLNTTTLSAGTYAGTLTTNITELLIDNPSARPGWYALKLTQGDTVLDQEWFAFINGGGTITFDADSYVSSQTAEVSHSITSFTIAEYIYEGQIIDIYGTEKESWSITTTGGTHDVDLTDYTSGTYFVMLKATDRDTGEEYVFDFASAEVNEEIWVNGTTYNAETGAALAGVTVGIEQFGTTTTNVTIADGSYALVTGLYADNPINVTATLAGYTHSNFSFTPMSNGLKTVNLYLVPTAPTFGGDAAIGGLVHNMPYRQAVSGATVTIENATWSDTTTANSAGYYLFDNLTINESYTVSSSQTGYQPSDEYTATAVNATFTQQDIEMSGIYTLTIELRDATDHSLISTSMTVEAGGAANVTTYGQTQFPGLDYGIVAVTVTGNDDYYGTSENVLVEEDATETIYLTRKTESTPFAYPPHNVKFVVRSAFGGPIEGVTVQATGYETSMGSWSWLFDLLGLDYEKTQIHNQTMNGTTGSDGAINFMMIEAIKYRITFAKAGEIETTWEGFPKDEYYTIWASEFGAGEWFEHGSDPFAVINVTVAGTSADDTSAALTVYYNDTLAETTSATAYLNQTFINGTEVNIGSYTETSDTWNHTFTIAGDHRGESYIVRLRAIHETYGNITRDYGVHYKPAPTSLGLPEDLLLFAAMGVMLFTCLFFGQTSVGAGCIIFALEGWIFFWLGWLADLGSEYAVGTVLVIITFVAFLVNVMHRSKRERFT